MGKSKLQIWEKILVLVSALLFCSSLFIYILDIHLMNFIFSMDENQSQNPIGMVSKQTGSFRQKKGGSNEFNPISENAPLYNGDILMTEKKSSVSLQFKNEAGLQLGENTMIRLMFADTRSLEGVRREDQIEVVQGIVESKTGRKKIMMTSPNHKKEVAPNTTQAIEVNNRIVQYSGKPRVINRIDNGTGAEAQKNPIETSQILASDSASVLPIQNVVPLPSPSPTSSLPSILRIISPRKGQHFKATSSSGKIFSIIDFTWELENVPEKFSLIVVRANKNEKSNVPVYKKTILISKNPKGIKIAVNQPGLYTWIIQADKPIEGGKTFQIQSNFHVDSDFEGIQMKSVGSKDQLGVGTEVVAEWSPVSHVTGYQVEVSRDVKFHKLLLKKEVGFPRIVFRISQLGEGEIHYRVSALLENRFIAYSNSKTFLFQYPPPLLVLPQNQFKANLKTILTEGNKILFTWQKTPFAQSYEFEIASNSEFKGKTLKKLLTQNLWVLPHPSDGAYWWRVRAISPKAKSPFSETFRFNIYP